MKDLTLQEVKDIEGGWYILRITGLHDGIKGNTDWHWFNFD